MAEFSYGCSVTQGFNFEPDNQDTVGFVNSCKIGETELSSTIEVKDPEDPANKLTVFGVLNSIYWEGRPTDPVQIHVHINTENKNLIAQMVHGTWTNTNVEIAFTVYDYDPDENKYYKCLHTNEEALLCLVFKAGSELQIGIDGDQAQEVMSPKNFVFSLGFAPQDNEEQQIHYAVSLMNKDVKPFGIKASG
jgi:hypothetical protein